MRPFIVALVLALALLAGLAAAARAAKTPKGLVDLNRATLLELMQLPGVGASRAEAIVRYRSSHPFQRTADLLRIKGVGRRTFARLRPFITVDPLPSPSSARPAPAPQPAPPPSAAPAPHAPPPPKIGTAPHPVVPPRSAPVSHSVPGAAAMQRPG